MKDKLFEAFLSWNAKKIIITLLFVFLLFVLAIIFFTLFLINEKNELDTKRDFIKEEMNMEAERLQNNLNEQILYYQTMKNRIDELELALDIKPYEEKVSDMDLRVDYLLLSSSQKSAILNLIPNGEVLKNHRGISDNFGTRIHPVLKIKSFHKGIDFRADLKTPVYSSANGVVEFAGVYGNFGYLVVIKHDFGFKTYYAHLDSKILVRQGQIVKKGEHIANSGNSGLSTGPHLHYEIRYLGISLDPKNFINWNIQNFESLFKKETKVKWTEVINLAVKSNKK